MAARQSGYIALIAVLVAGAVALASSLSILMIATNRARETSVEQQSVTARALASGCTEEALQVIHDQTSYTGSGTYTLSTNSCTYTVTYLTSTTRSILAVATVGNIVRKVQAYVTINATTISITSWQEVS